MEALTQTELITGLPSSFPLYTLTTTALTHTHQDALSSGVRVLSAVIASPSRLTSHPCHLIRPSLPRAVMISLLRGTKGLERSFKCLLYVCEGMPGEETEGGNVELEIVWGGRGQRTDTQPGIGMLSETAEDVELDC